MPSPALTATDEALVLDFSSSSVRALYWQEEPPPRFFEYALPPWLIYEQIPVAEIVSQVVSWVEEDLGFSLKENEAWRPKLLLVGQMASLELKKLLAFPPIDPATILKYFSFPIFLARSRLSAFDTYSLREPPDPIKVVRWLPFAFNPYDLEDYLRNVLLFTQVFPDTQESIYIRQAVAKENLRTLASRSGQDFSQRVTGRSVHLIGSVFSDIPYPSQAVAVFLDGVRPRGSVRLKRDSDQWLPCLGALQAYMPELAERVYQYWQPDELGTTVGLGGEANCVLAVDKQAPYEFRVAEGEIVRLPLETKSQGMLKARTARGVQQIMVWGGQVGLVIDARPFDFHLPDGFVERQALLQKWDHELSAHGQVTAF